MLENDGLPVKEPKSTRWSVGSSGGAKGYILCEGLAMLPEDVALYLNSIDDLRCIMEKYFGRSKDAVFGEAIQNLVKEN